jgi:hypothetical protein
MLFAHPSLLPVRVRAALEVGTRRITVPSSVRMTTVLGAFVIAGALGCFRFGQTAEPKPVVSNYEPIAERSEAPRTVASKEKPQTPAPSPRVADGTREWTDAAAKGLIGLLSDPSPQVRAASVKSLGQLAIPQTRKAIEAMLGDPEKNVEYEAREALKNFPSSR